MMKYEHGAQLPLANGDGPQAGTPRIGRILILEDLDSDFRLLQRHLQRQLPGVHCLQVRDGAELTVAMDTGGWDVVLADHQLPGIDFDAALQLLRTRLPEVPVILVSGTIGEERAVDLLRKGVTDFVFKDRLGRLVPALHACLEALQVRHEADRAARALADSEAFSRAVLGSMDDALFIAQGRRFVFFNPALPALLGYDEEGFRGLPFESVVAPESLELWDERYRRRISGELPEPERRYEVVFLHRDGRRIWFELRAARFEYQGRAGVLGMLRDVTERRRILAELEQHRHHLEVLVEERTHKAEAASRAKTTFLANMSHEIRTPLNAITGSVYMLLREATDPETRARLRTADDAARHLLRLVDDVLDLSKIESGKLTLDAEDFELEALIARTLDMVVERAREKGLALEREIDAPPVVLRGDATRISQVLLNLLGNAVKFTERGSVRLVCRLHPRGDRSRLLRLEVHDTGIGIAPQRIEHVFDAFEQADDSTTRRYGGTGLGLAIARRLAELMHGNVGAHSVPGQGSVFWFTAELELAHRQQPPAPAELSRTPQVGADQALRDEFSGARVLVADDNPVNRVLTAELLQLVGLQVDTVDDGYAALERVQRAHYHLLLLDVQMPGLDGLQASRMIREMDGLKALPILALTANAFREGRDACLAAGMNDHIVKPVEPHRLYETLLRWLRLGRPSFTAPRAAPAPARAIGPQPASAPDAAMTQAQLHVSGLQPQAELAHAGGLHEADVRHLARFCELYGAGLPGLVDGAAGEDATREALQRAVHSLADAAGAVGASSIAAQARHLDQALAAGTLADVPDLALALERLQQDLRRLVDALESSLQAR